jgi:hypothetical protein
MGLARKKVKVQASEVEVGSRTLEGVLLDLAEQARTNAERSARAEQVAADAAQRAARAEELATIALQTIAAVSQDLRAMTHEMREENARARVRLDALERAKV